MSCSFMRPFSGPSQTVMSPPSAADFVLDETQFLSEGNNRIVFIHPANPNEIIKISKTAIPTRDQNYIEFNYLYQLNRNNIPFTHIAKIYDWVKTSCGLGLVFERIMNDDGSLALPLHECMKQQLISEVQACDLLAKLYDYLYHHAIIFADVGLDNVVCQRIQGQWKLVIIDGLGARELGFKFFLYQHCRFLARRKLTRQWQLFVHKLKRAIRAES